MPVAYKLTIDRAVIARVGRAAALAEVTDTTRRVFNRATILTPVRTGRLRAGNQMRVNVAGSIATGEVFNNTAYARPVHDGAPAHTIRPKPHKITVRPKNGKYLRFVVGGRVVYARQVVMQKPLRFVVGGRVVYAQSARVPARKGRPWLLRALKEIAVPRGYAISGT